MSIVLFWSPYHGQGQTSNLHASAFVMGLKYKKRVLMMQTQYMGNNLESPLVGQNVSKKKSEDHALFEDVGLDMAVTFCNMNKLTAKMLENCCFSFPNTPLLLLPGTAIENRETFERDIAKNVSRVIRDADECVDLVLIDANSGDDNLSFKLMSMADLIIINLTQHRYVLDKFFAEDIEHFAANKKVFYLFGDYDDNSCFNINNVRRKYRGYINSRNSGIIPYCTKFLDAQNESDVVRFMMQGLYIKETGRMESFFRHIDMVLGNQKYSPEETRYFFYHSCLSVDKMLDLLNISAGIESKMEKGRLA